MTRTQGDELVAACCLLPCDAVRRNALADWLREGGEDGLADSVSGRHGESLIRATTAIAHHLKREPSATLLFAVRYVRDIANHLYPVSVVYHPEGYLDPSDPSRGLNRDYAIYLAEQIESVTVCAFPDARVDSGQPAWRIEHSPPSGPWTVREPEGQDGRVQVEAEGEVIDTQNHARESGG